MPWRANNRGSLLHRPLHLITNGDQTVYYCMYTCHTFGPIQHHKTCIIHAAGSRMTGWCWFPLSPLLCVCWPDCYTSKDSDPEHWLQPLTRCTMLLFREETLFFLSPKSFLSGKMLMLLLRLHCNDYHHTYLALEVFGSLAKYVNSLIISNINERSESSKHVHTSTGTR